MKRGILLEIKTIGLLGVNCYLVNTGNGYILIDTGFSFKRHAIERELENAGCKPGNLRLIIITHGDSDHTGNAAYLRKKYGTKIAAHPAESAAMEKGNMRLSRKMSRKSTRILAGMVFNLPFARLSKSGRFKPDLYIEDGHDFSEYGFNARVLHVPGHTSGSIAVLTAEGDLFCGDLFRNNGKPSKNNLVDDSAEMNASIERLEGLNIKAIYPGHGKAFTLLELLR